MPLTALVKCRAPERISTSDDHHQRMSVSVVACRCRRSRRPVARPRSFGKLAASTGRCVGRRSIRENVLHPDLDRDFHIRVRQNIEAIALHGFDRDTGDIDSSQLPGLDRLSDAIRVLLRFRVGLRQFRRAVPFGIRDAGIDKCGAKNGDADGGILRA